MIAVKGLSQEIVRLILLRVRKPGSSRGDRERQLVACLVVFQPPCASNTAYGGLLRKLSTTNNLTH